MQKNGLNLAERKTRQKTSLGVFIKPQTLEMAYPSLALEVD